MKRPAVAAKDAGVSAPAEASVRPAGTVAYRAPGAPGIPRSPVAAEARMTPGIWVKEPIWFSTESRWRARSRRAVRCAKLSGPRFR